MSEQNCTILQQKVNYCFQFDDETFLRNSIMPRLGTCLTKENYIFLAAVFLQFY